jgi:heme/copper-type cytochrome/quinol oxidase subunit 4
MFILLIQSLVALPIMNSGLGTEGLFYMLAAFQLIVCLHLFIYMKETKNIPKNLRKTLYSI